MTITITNLPVQNSVTDNTLLPVETSGITGHITALALQNYIATGSLPSISASSAIINTLAATTITTGTITATGNIYAQANLVVSGNLYTGRLKSRNI